MDRPFNRIAQYLPAGREMDNTAPKKSRGRPPKAAEPSEFEKKQADAIKRAIDACRMKQQDVADVLGVSPSTVSRMLKGFGLPSTLADWEPIARAIGALVEPLHNDGEYVADPYWRDVRSVRIEDKVSLLKNADDSRRALTSMVDLLFGQHIVLARHRHP